VIRKRLESIGATENDLFAPGIMRELILLSGGQPTELMSLVRESLISFGLPISETSLARARREGRRPYERALCQEHWPLLREASQDGKLTRCDDNDRAFRELLESRAILLYINDEEWYGINPFVQSLIPALKEYDTHD
jgi:hypothetical protein